MLVVVYRHKITFIPYYWELSLNIKLGKDTKYKHLWLYGNYTEYANPKRSKLWVVSCNHKFIHEQFSCEFDF